MLTDAETRARIEQDLGKHGFIADSFRTDPDDGITAVLNHRWRVLEDDDNLGLCANDEGKLEACLVGAEEYGNLHVIYTFTPDGFDSGCEVTDPVGQLEVI